MDKEKKREIISQTLASKSIYENEDYTKSLILFPAMLMRHMDLQLILKK